MRNLVCRDLDELHQELDLAVGRSDRSLIWSVPSLHRPG